MSTLVENFLFSGISFQPCRAIWHKLLWRGYLVYFQHHFVLILHTHSSKDILIHFWGFFWPHSRLTAFWFFCFSAAALAVLAKKNMQPSPQEKSQNYLGLLFPTEQYRVYGYITNTNAKFVLVLNDQSTAKDPEIKQVHFSQIRRPPLEIRNTHVISCLGEISRSFSWNFIQCLLTQFQILSTLPMRRFHREDSRNRSRLCCQQACSSVEPFHRHLVNIIQPFTLFGHTIYPGTSCRTSPALFERVTCSVRWLRTWELLLFELNS